MADCPSGVKVLRIDRPEGRRVLKFDGAFGPEGCGGGFAASFIRPPSAASRSLSTHKRQVLRATFFSSMLPAHPPFRGERSEICLFFHGRKPGCKGFIIRGRLL